MAVVKVKDKKDLVGNHDQFFDSFMWEEEGIINVVTCLRDYLAVYGGEIYFPEWQTRHLMRHQKYASPPKITKLSDPHFEIYEKKHRLNEMYEEKYELNSIKENEKDFNKDTIKKWQKE